MAMELTTEVEELKVLLNSFSGLVDRLERVNGLERRNINDMCAANIKYRIENLKYHTSKLTENIHRAESYTQPSFGR
jgi:hypothetical protein